MFKNEKLKKFFILLPTALLLVPLIIGLIKQFQ
jgi:hypothetical protein